MTPPPSRTTWKRGAALGAGFALAATLVATQAGPAGLSASSHREAPLIAGDPRADNTDVYAFTSPDDPDTVTLIANWIPFEEPNGGPNFYPWAEDTRYNINVDNDGDAVADLAYTWVFTTITKDPGTFIYNTGPFDSVFDDTLNVYQTYDLTVRDLAGTPTDESDDTEVTILDDAVAAPSIAGAASTPDYQPLVDEAVASGTVGDLRSFAGQSDDSFFLDLRVFDLLYGGDLSELGEDTLAGYNVNTIALQVPKAAVALGGDAEANPVIGVWSTTDRPTTRNADGTSASGEYTQVSRLGNPLVNEVVLPLALKDTFNAIDPTVEATVDAAVEAVQFPILPPLVNAVYGVPVPGDDGTPQDTSDDTPRSDLVEIFLQGVSEANFGLGTAGEDAETNPALNVDLNSLALNAGVDTIYPSEMLRLNMAVPVAEDPNRLGVLAGDVQGFPNGRRLTDDVTDIAIQVAEGVVFQDGSDVSGLAALDSVDRNDRDFKDEFPYVANPHLDSVNQGIERTPRAPEVISVDPERLLDTRTGTKPAAGEEIELAVAGVGDAMVPSDAKAVFLNITATQADANGFITVYACDEDRPTASSLNPEPGRIVSGLIPAQLDDDGNVCIYTESSANIIVDVFGYLPSTSSYDSINPQRLLDTRSGAKPGAGDVTVIDVTGVGDAALADDTSAVFVNITAVRSETKGWITAYPCDEDRPTASNLNTNVGIRAANLASVKVSAEGTICVYTDAAMDLVVDLVGAFPATSSYVPTNPQRLLDTRNGVGYSGAKPIADQVIELRVRGGSTGVPDDSGTVVLNVTGVNPDDIGYLTVFPCGEAPPTASNLNLQTENTASAVVAKVGDNDRVCIYTKSAADVIVDLVGYFPGTVLAS
ncbi:DUF4331 domain-containing protein [Ilumatobacter sp.]|uniref:DUF4331 domain-containing protein n=1 Tax=Ilumatobacter sp. TaxID=1967498 RepID=UPI003B51AF43